MDAPRLVVVDASAAVEALVAEADCHEGYVALLGSIRRAKGSIAYSELLEPELVEAAYTWDIRRQSPGGWRALRRDQNAQRDRALERTVLRAWRSLAGEQTSVVIPIRAVVDASVEYVTDTGLGSYDAVHLATAHHLRAPILTHDRFMIRVAHPAIPVITLREEAQ